MDDVTILIFAGVCLWFGGSIFGWYVREQVAVRKVSRMFAELEKSEEVVKDDKRVHCELEIHHGHFYVFDKETGKFYGQGETAKELGAVLKEQHPDKIFVLPDEDCDMLGIK